MTIHTQEILNAYHFRYACKEFHPAKKVSEEDFHTILEAARLFPSSFSFEPWKFLVIEDQQVKDELFPLAWGAQNSLRGASHFVIILARKASCLKADAPYITHMMEAVQGLPAEIVKKKRAAFA